LTDKVIKDISESLGVSMKELKAQAEVELARRRQSEFLLSEPYAFHKDVLCDPTKIDYLRPFHQEGLEWINRKSGKRLKLILWPRGHLKSTIFTQGETTRRLLNNPNLRAFIASSTSDMAKTFLSAIKGYLAHEKIKELYGDVIPTTKSAKYFKNNEFELTVLSRNNIALREPSIAVAGLEATRTSQHYDLIVCDDLVVEENVGNFDQMDKVWRIWQTYLDLLEPDGEMWVIGTRYHPLDLYGRILTDYVDPRCYDGYTTTHVDGCSCEFDVSVMQLRDADGGYIFDSKFDDKIAKQLLNIKGQRFFSCQYENNPSSADTVWFDQKEIDNALVSREEIDAIRSKLVWYMACDPAESLERRSSFTAVINVGVDHSSGVWYVDFAKQARVDTGGFIKLIFDSHKLCRPNRFGMELVTRKALGYVLKDRMADLGYYFSIEEVKPSLGNKANAKETRIRGLKPLFEAGRLKICEDLRDLLSILYTIPASPTYDLADCLSFILQMVPKGLGTDTFDRAVMPPKVTQNKGLTYGTRRNSRTGLNGQQQRIKSGLGHRFRRVYSSSRSVR